MNIPEYYLYEAERCDNRKLVQGYYVKINGRKTIHFIYTGYAEFDCDEVFPERLEIDPETLHRVKEITKIMNDEIKDAFEATKHICKIVGITEEELLNLLSCVKYKKDREEEIQYIPEKAGNALRNILTKL